jgi:hypothetical protein
MTVYKGKVASAIATAQPLSIVTRATLTSAFILICDIQPVKTE